MFQKKAGEFSSGPRRRKTDFRKTRGSARAAQEEDGDVPERNRNKCEGCFSICLGCDDRVALQIYSGGQTATLSPHICCTLTGVALKFNILERKTVFIIISCHMIGRTLFRLVTAKCRSEIHPHVFSGSVFGKGQ